MRKTIRRSLVAAAAVAAGVGLTATPASAATWTVTGANPDGSAAAESSNTSLRIVRNNAVLTCDLVTVEANVANTTGSNGDAIGQILASTWTSCTGPLGLTFTVTQNGIWNLNADTPVDGDVSVGSATNVSATINGPGCTAQFSGGAQGTYTNSTATLTFDPNGANPRGVTLTASGVSGCFGVVQNGDVGQFAGDFAVDPPITLTGTP